MNVCSVRHVVRREIAICDGGERTIFSKGDLSQFFCLTYTTKMHFIEIRRYFFNAAFALVRFTDPSVND